MSLRSSFAHDGSIAPSPFCKDVLSQSPDALYFPFSPVTASFRGACFSSLRVSSLAKVLYLGFKWAPENLKAIYRNYFSDFILTFLEEIFFRLNMQYGRVSEYYTTNLCIG